MNKFNGFNSKKRALRILHPFLILYGWMGKKVQRFAEKKRRITASVLAFCMVFTILPLGAFPVRAKAELTSSSGKTIVVDGSSYALTSAGLTSAITSAAYGDTIDVRSDIRLESTLVVSKDVTITSSNNSTLFRDWMLNKFMIKVSEGNTLTIQSITLDGNNVYSDPIIYLYKSHLVMEDGTIIKGNYCDYGSKYLGTVSIGLYGTFTMNGGSITSNYAYYGAGVYVFDGTFTMNGGVISGNSAFKGGAVCTGGEYKLSTFNMNGGIISENTAYWQGGGVFIHNGMFNMSNSIISNNKASNEDNGGGVYNMGYFTMNNSIIKGNSAKNGGGVYNTNSFTMNNSTISGNTAKGDGGGVFCTGKFGNYDNLRYSGIFNLHSGDISNNKSSGSGGGLYVELGLLQLYGGNIMNNTAAVLGGGILIDRTIFNVTGSACVTDNYVGTIASNVYLPKDRTIFVSGSFTGAIGITKEGTTGKVAIAEVISDHKDQFFIDNMVSGSRYYDTIYATQEIVILEVTDLVKIVNTFSELKAAISKNPFTDSFNFKPYINVKKDISVTNTLAINSFCNFTVFSSNSSKILRGAGFTDHIFRSSGYRAKLTLRDITLDGHSDNSTTSAISNYDSSKLILNPGAVIQNNHISDDTLGVDTGGAVFNDKGVFIMNGGALLNNSAYRNGGGVRNLFGSIFTMNGGSISGNTAIIGGGGGVNTNGTFTMRGGSIKDNSAPEYRGGGVYNSGDFIMTNGNIMNNKASNNPGGGVYSTGPFTINGGSVLNNTAKYGGGVYSKNTLTMNGGSITGNTAYYGGGVYSRHTFNMNAGTISGNTGINAGGGVCNDMDYTFTMNGGSITSNITSINGGGVYIDANGTFTMVRGIIANNKADADGGGVYNNSTLNLNGGTISVNKAGGNGGGVYNSSDKTFTMKSGSISRNTANNGGGVYNYGTFNMSGGTILYNLATLADRAVHNSGTFNMSGGIITDYSGIVGEVNPNTGYNANIVFWIVVLFSSGSVFFLGINQKKKRRI